MFKFLGYCTNCKAQLALYDPEQKVFELQDVIPGNLGWIEMS